ncbi:hypothetical protein FJ250_07940 [bacterium]|nr:hypothetical protein [bacterium]
MGPGGRDRARPAAESAPAGAGGVRRREFRGKSIPAADPAPEIARPAGRRHVAPGAARPARSAAPFSRRPAPARRGRRIPCVRP